MVNSRLESKDLSVYDFSAEELEVESFACMYTAKFKAKSEFKENRVDDPNFEPLQDCNSTPEASFIDSPGKKVTIGKSMFNENVTSSTSYAECPGMCLDEFDTDMLIKEDSIAKPVNDLQSNGTPVDVISKDEESSTPSPVSLSANASDHEGDMEHYSADIHITAHEEKETDGLSVIVSPDYIIYENTLYGEAQLVFSSDSVLVKFSDTNGDIFVECAVADILYIESQWSESVGATLIKFHFGVNTVNKDEVHETHDFMELIFSVTDMSWLDKEQKIKCLAERYKVVWNIPRYGNYDLEEACVAGKNFFPRYYFTEVPYSFEEVVYPKDDPDAVSISRREIELLEPNTFVNDTIIDFYIKYLKTKIPVNERHKYHFFNSFFFRKLADLDKDHVSASEGRAAFLRVRKWTRKINIFEKDYIFIPVNFSLHWSLLVICHPGEVGILKDGEVKDSPIVPCILHMDSLKGNHSGLKDIIQSYLLEEWKERHPEATEDYTSEFSNLRFVPLELPQQENTFDCGLFLLHYVELFLQETALDFNPLKISKSSSFLTPDWFIPSEASFKRTLIRKLIYELLDDNFQNVTSESRLNDTNMEKTPISEHCTQSKTAHNASASSIMVNGIELNIGTSSDPCIQHDKNEELSMHEVSKPGTNSACIFKEDASIQMLACSTEVVKNDELEQHITSGPDDDIYKELDEMPKALTFLTANNVKDTEEIDIQPDSRQEKEEVVISPKACDSATIQNENSEKQDYAQDTPISSSGENQDNDSLVNDEEGQVPNTTDIGNEKCDHVQLVTAPDSGDDVKHEKTEVQSLIDGIELENCNHTSPDENLAGINKNDNDDNDKVEEIAREDSKEIEVTPEGKGENVIDGQQTDTHDVISEVPKDIIDVEEKPDGDSPRKKRGGPNTKNATNSRKKRKVSQPEGQRRLTRSAFKKRNARK